MSIRNLIPLFVLILFSCTNKKNYLVSYNIKGKVKRIIMDIYKAEEKFGEVRKGDITNRRTIVFNKQGNIIDHKEYDAQGILEMEIGFMYDDEGNLIEMNNYNSEHVLESKTFHKFDSKGNLIEASHYTVTDSLLAKFIYKYNNAGQVIEVNAQGGAGETSRVLIYYDKNGNYIKRDLGDEIFTYKYQDYDKNGNWKKQITYSNDLPIEMVEQQIEYYE